jgi:hypothetical protein
LGDNGKANAFAIGVDNMRILIAKLGELNKPLSYTDSAEGLPFWQQLNQGLIPIPTHNAP